MSLKTWQCPNCEGANIGEVAADAKSLSCWWCDREFEREKLAVTLAENNAAVFGPCYSSADAAWFHFVVDHVGTIIFVSMAYSWGMRDSGRAQCFEWAKSEGWTVKEVSPRPRAGRAVRG